MMDFQKIPKYEIMSRNSSDVSEGLGKCTKTKLMYAPQRPLIFL